MAFDFRRMDYSLRCLHFPRTVNLRNLLKTEDSPYDVCYHFCCHGALIVVVVVMEEETSVAQKAVDKK